MCIRDRDNLSITMEFDKNSTLKLAKLARLSLNDEQLNNLEKDLTSIVSFIDQLKEIDTDKIDPTSNSLDQDLILREDVAENKLSNEDLLKNVPESELGFFVVPKVIE